jgi:hypothetical protein
MGGLLASSSQLENAGPQSQSPATCHLEAPYQIQYKLNIFLCGWFFRINHTDVPKVKNEESEMSKLQGRRRFPFVQEP